MIFTLLVALVAAEAHSDRACVVDCVKQQAGKPYVLGGNGPDNYDCSGLVYYCYKQCGFSWNIRPTTGSLINSGSSIMKKNLMGGDLVFPKSGHVQVYIGGNQVVHVPENGKVTQEALGTTWAIRRLIQGGAMASGGTSGGGDGGSSNSGQCTVVVDQLNVRASSSTSSEVVATYGYGDIIAYDSVVTNGECTWISYIGGSGNRRYVCGKNPSGSCYVSPCP